MSSNPNRIDPLSFTQSVDRQTPDNSFGAVLARTTGSVLGRGTAFMGGVISQVPVASAAVSGVGGIVASALTTSAPLGIVSASPSAVAVSASGVRSSAIPSSGLNPVGTTAATGTTGTGDAWELLQAQQSMNMESFSLNNAYLGMQKQMEQESREFNLVSNIMKTRHDTAKASINNIR